MELLFKIGSTAMCFFGLSGFIMLLSYPQDFSAELILLIRGTFLISSLIILICLLILIWVF